MAAKRLLNDSERDPDKPDDKRMRNNPTRPSFASYVLYLYSSYEVSS